MPSQAPEAPIVHNPYSPPTSGVADVDRTASLARPLTATVGTWIFWLVIIASALNTVYGVFTKPEFHVLPTFAQVAALVVVVVIYAVCFWFVFALGRGRNWGRIAITVVMAIAIAALLFNMRLGASLSLMFSVAPAETVIMVSALVVEIVGLVLLYSRPSNAWYAAVKEANA